MLEDCAHIAWTQLILSNVQYRLVDLCHLEIYGEKQGEIC